MKLSARNQFKGKILDIQEGAVNGIVKIDIGGGNVISATISMTSIKELGLQVGGEAYAVIKATSVMVGAKQQAGCPLYSGHPAFFARRCGTACIPAVETV